MSVLPSHTIITTTITTLHCLDTATRLHPAPRQVIGKFSIRIVPDQTPEVVMALTETYMRKRWQERNSPNNFRMWGDGDRGWLADTNTTNFQAGIRCRELLYLVLDTI